MYSNTFTFLNNTSWNLFRKFYKTFSSQVICLKKIFHSFRLSIPTRVQNLLKFSSQHVPTSYWNHWNLEHFNEITIFLKKSFPLQRRALSHLQYRRDNTYRVLKKKKSYSFSIYQKWIENDYTVFKRSDKYCHNK